MRFWPDPKNEIGNEVPIGRPREKWKNANMRYQALGVGRVVTTSSDSYMEKFNECVFISIDRPHMPERSEGHLVTFIPAVERTLDVRDNSTRCTPLQ